MRAAAAASWPGTRRPRTKKSGARRSLEPICEQSVPDAAFLMLVRPRRAKLGNQSAPARTQFGRGEPNRWLTKRLAAAGGAVPAVSAPLLFVPRCGGGGAEREEPLRVCVCVFVPSFVHGEPFCAPAAAAAAAEAAAADRRPESRPTGQSSRTAANRSRRDRPRLDRTPAAASEANHRPAQPPRSEQSESSELKLSSATQQGAASSGAAGSPRFTDAAFARCSPPAG